MSEPQLRKLSDIHQHLKNLNPDDATNDETFMNIIKQFPNGEKLFNFALQIKPIGEFPLFEIDDEEGTELIDVLKRLLFKRKIKQEYVKDVLNLMAYLIFLKKSTIDDFRIVIINLYKAGHKGKATIKKINRDIVWLGLFDDWKETEDFVNKIWEYTTFLGTPIMQEKDIIDVLKKFNIDGEILYQSDTFRLKDLINRRGEFLDEIFSEMKFNYIYNKVKETSRRIVHISYKYFENKAYSSIESNGKFTLEEAFDKVSKKYEEYGLISKNNLPYPIRLYKLENPPEIEPLSYEVFSKVPEPILKGVMPALAYSGKIRHIEIEFLGGPRIGRSGILIKTDYGAILLDYGFSVAHLSIPKWAPDLENLDAILITHAHIDHVGGLPALFEYYDQKWMGVGPTGVISKMLLRDSLKVSQIPAKRKKDIDDPVHNIKAKNIDKLERKYVSLEYDKEYIVSPGVTVRPIDAKHVPGSAAYEIDIEGFKILYTGDFNLDNTFLYEGAILPTDADVTIFDGTYWGREDFDRLQAVSVIKEAVQNYGPVIIPAFALGRAQEIVMMLDQYGISRERNVLLSGMALSITKMSGVSGKFRGLLRTEKELKKDDILVSGGGMLEGGEARKQFEYYKEHEEAAIVFTGFLARGTYGYWIHKGLVETTPRVFYARLSAHSSASKLEKFVSQLKGKKVMVHTPATSAPDDVLIPEFGTRLKFDL